MDQIQLHSKLLQRSTEAPNITFGEPLPGWLQVPVTSSQYSTATAALIVPLILQLIALIVFSARVYTRAYPVWKFTIDDYLISLAFAFTITMFGFGLASNIWAWGGARPAFLTLDHLQYNAKYGALTVPMWAWATGLVKISIGCMLLRFQQSSRWRWFMIGIIILCVAVMMFTVITTLIQCIPFSDAWDIRGINPFETKHCLGIELNNTFLYITAGFTMSLDFIFSLMPLTFLGKIRRPLREKVVIGSLMALGLFASGFSLGKALLTRKLTKLGDAEKGNLAAYLNLIGLMSQLEVQTALIAACIPTLRNSTRRLLVRIKFLHPSRNSGYRRYGARSGISGASKGARRVSRTVHDLGSVGSISTGDADGIRAIDDDDENQYTVDPVTGRVICVAPERAHLGQPNKSSLTFSSDLEMDSIEPTQPRILIKDGWETKRGIGVAR